MSNHVTTQKLGLTHSGCKLTTYCLVVNYMLETYATDDIIAEKKLTLTVSSKQPA